MDKLKAPWYYIPLLILAGESVFVLPFVIVRVFRPTVLEVFNLNNVELGICFSVYGIIALISYFFGGPIADKYPPRKLIAISLWLTALGGFVYAMFPGYTILQLLYGYWGFTSIFLFWAPMIKATRAWGGSTSQGKAFGFLDGGRGLVGALFGAVGVYLFALMTPEEVTSTSFYDRQESLKQVILFSSGIVMVTGVLVWFFMKMNRNAEQTITLDKISFAQIGTVFRLPAVILLMIITLCAYMGYKVTDIVSLYARDVLLYDQLESAEVGTILQFIRPVVGVGIGVLADRTQITSWLLVSFTLSFLGSILFATGVISSTSILLFFLSLLIIATGVYAARVMYFAVMQSGRIPLILTGTAVGLISIVGYTPDIFAGPLIGVLLDESPGREGHQHVFWMLSIFSFIGGAASWIYHRLYKK